MSRLPALFVLAGLVHGTAPAAPVPPLETATAQLRAINHRFVNGSVDPGGDLLQAMTHDDFVLTQGDGDWRDRGHFIEQARQQSAPRSAASEEQRVRLFGRVALVHGVFAALGPAGHTTRVRYTDVYLWSGTAWQLVSAQDTPLKDTAALHLVAGTAPAHAPWQGQDPRGADLIVLQALNESYVKAFRDADVGWYDAHLAPDYLVVQSDGTLHDRAAALTRFAQPTFAIAMKSFPVDRVSVRRFDDVALIHAENAYELKDGRTGISRYTDIWHKRDGRWLCIAAHITM